MFDLMKGAVALEFSHQWPDSVGQHLADLGCEVIKIEPLEGSQTRGLWVLEDVSMCHEVWNRSKKSLPIDVKSEAGVELLREIIPQVNILIAGFRAGTVDRLGFSYDEVKALNPSIVYARLSGWGNDSPYRNLATNGAGFDGYAGLQPPDVRDDGLFQLPDMPSTRGEVHYGAVVGVMHAAMTAVAAWGRQNRTGQGACIDVAEADAAVGMKFDHLFWKLNFDIDDGHATPWPASVRTRYQYYRTADDQAIFWSPAQPQFWERFCEVLERPDLLDSTCDTESERLELAAIAKTKTRAEWVTWCLDHDIPVAPVNDKMDDLLADPHFRARHLIAEVPDRHKGTIKMFTTPVHVEGQSFMPKPAPELGEHTDDLLARFGIARSRIDDLRNDGVIY